MATTPINGDQHLQHEHGLQLASTVSLYVGIAAAIVTILGSIVWRELRNSDLPAVVGIAGIGSAYGLILWSAVERLFRSSRRCQRIAAERLERLAGVQEQVLKRLDGIDHEVANLPDYGSGVIDGVRMRQTVVGE